MRMPRKLDLPRGCVAIVMLTAYSIHRDMARLLDETHIMVLRLNGMQIFRHQHGQLNQIRFYSSHMRYALKEKYLRI